MTSQAFKSRRTNFIAAAGLSESEAVLVTNPIDIAYLSGFTGSNGTMVVLSLIHI